jgi:hypothetical protein
VPGGVVEGGEDVVGDGLASGGGGASAPGDAEAGDVGCVALEVFEDVLGLLDAAGVLVDEDVDEEGEVVGEASCALGGGGLEGGDLAPGPGGDEGGEDGSGEEGGEVG